MCKISIARRGWWYLMKGAKIKLYVKHPYDLIQSTTIEQNDHKAVDTWGIDVPVLRTNSWNGKVVGDTSFPPTPPTPPHPPTPPPLVTRLNFGTIVIDLSGRKSTSSWTTSLDASHPFSVV
jgi:hypothetical protein